MAKYILQRIVALILTLFIILTISFLVIRLMPGSVYGESAELSETVMEALDAKYHFNKPLIVQYKYFLQNLTKWDWGTSLAIQPSVPVYDIIKGRIPVSLQISLISLFIAVPFGITFGTIAAIKKNTLVDHGISLLIVLFISVPSFIFASLLQYTVAYKMDLLPIIYDTKAALFSERFTSLILPITALALGPVARIARYLRAELSEVMNSDFLLLARTKGLTYAQSVVRHGMRNSFLPLINIMIPMLTNIIGGSLVIETIFAIPGMGGLMIDSINASDHFVTIAVLVFYSLISLMTMLVVDITYGIVDPRIRVGGGR